jgi:hypothetical protein
MPDEYISREAALKALFAPGMCYAPMQLQIIKDLPAADVAPVVHGRWEQDADGDWYCTTCDEVVAICESGRERTYRKPYCPNCGAKMDGGDSDATD